MYDFAFGATAREFDLISDRRRPAPGARRQLDRHPAVAGQSGAEIVVSVTPGEQHRAAVRGADRRAQRGRGRLHRLRAERRGIASVASPRCRSRLADSPPAGTTSARRRRGARSSMSRPQHQRPRRWTPAAPTSPPPSTPARCGPCATTNPLPRRSTRARRAVPRSSASTARRRRPSSPASRTRSRSSVTASTGCWSRFDDYADPTTPYMYHCYLLWHEDQGMMGQFLVVEPGQQPDLKRPRRHR